MAFEDRCSPSQASSPGPVAGRVPLPHPETPPSSYQPPSQYTCTTINQRFDRSPTMTVVKVQPNSPPPSPMDVSQEDSSVYQNYYQNERPESPDIKPVIPPAQIDLGINFSISNILHPEFGLNAIRKTTNKIEGPKPVGPNHSILYKPYDLSKAKPAPKAGYSFDYKAKVDEPRLPPLGGLRQTISQIGLQREVDAPVKGADVTPQTRPDSANSMVSSTSSGAPSTCSGAESNGQAGNGTMWPAWVFCTRYSDRPSSGPRSRRSKKNRAVEEKRPRTAFSGSQLGRLKHEFAENRYLTERRRQQLAAELGLAEAQIKIWFQNKRAKIKKATGQRNPLALQLMAQGLYNHTTATESDEEEEISVT